MNNLAETRSPELQTQALKVKAHVLAYLAAEQDARLSQFFEHALGRLEAVSARAADREKSEAADRAAVWFQRGRATVRKELYRSMVEQLDGEGAGDAAELTELSMMDETELAVSIARARMVTGVFRQSQHLLDEMEARLTQLRDHGASIVPDALSPGRIADVIVKVLAEHQLPVAAQATLLDALGDAGIRELIRFYDGLNQLLAAHGVMTDGLQSPSPAAVVPQPEVESPADQIEIDPLVQLWKLMIEVPRSAWRRGQLRYMLHRYNRTKREHSGNESLPMRQMDELERYLLGFLSDAQCSERMRSEIIHLLVPILGEQAQLAPQFLEQHNPMRVFLEELLEIGRRDQEQPLQDFELVQVLVGRIVAEQGQVLDSFYSGAEGIHTIARREVTRRVRHQLKSVSAADADFDLKAPEMLARERVVAELEELIPEVEMEPQLKEFVIQILGPWMMVRYQRYGDGSTPWAEARAYASLFFDALKPADTDADIPRKRALRRQTLLQARLRVQRANAFTPQTERLLCWLENRLATLDESDAAGQAQEDFSMHLIDASFLDSLPMVPLTA